MPLLRKEIVKIFLKKKLVCGEWRSNFINENINLIIHLIFNNIVFMFCYLLDHIIISTGLL